MMVFTKYNHKVAKKMESGEEYFKLQFSPWM